MTSPAFSFYAKDWLAATMAWSLEARGAYMTLLAYQWDAGSVPTSHDAIARVLGVSKSKALELWAIIGLKFEIGPDGHWHNPRLELERAKQVTRRAALSAFGAQGGRPRKPKGKPKGKPKQSLGFSKTKAKAKPNESLSSSSSDSSFGTIPPNPPTGGTRVTREHKQQARVIWRSRLGYCEHAPACPNQVVCTDRIAEDLARKAVASC